jgi:hypothetical protein
MEGKIIENLDILIHDVNECRNSLELLLSKIGSEQSIENQLDWPLILNNLRIVSTNLISITKSIKDKKDSILKSSILLPKHFSEEIDYAIKEKTNNRISIFNQDVIPNILRTKLIPQIETNEMKSYQVSKEYELQKTWDKNVAQLKKTIDDSANLVEKPKREIENLKLNSISSYNYNDTWQLANLVINLSQTHNVRVNQRGNSFSRSSIQ